MGKLIVIGNEKGGVGKSTLSCNIAIQLLNDGHEVLVVDTDRQNSLGDFCEHHNAMKNIKKLYCIQKCVDTFDALTDLKDRYDYVVVDAGGQDSVELRSSLMCADLHIMPLKASQFDLWACQRMDDLLKRVSALNRGIKTKTLVNMASTHVSVTEDSEAFEFLNDFDVINNLFKTIIHERKGFRDSIKQGLSINEHDKGSKGSLEFLKLYQEILNELQ